MKRIQSISWAYLLALIFFVWGFAVGHHQVFPYSSLSPYYHQAFEHFSKKESIFQHIQESKSHYDFEGFKHIDESFIDSGFLLLSRFAKERNQTVIQLVRLSDFKVMHEWVPPIKEILSATKDNKGFVDTADEFRAQHPLLFSNGDVVFHTGDGPLVRLDNQSRIVWIINKHFHHSIEMAPDGNIITSFRIHPNSLGKDSPFFDDGLAVVSPDGKFLRSLSIGHILMQNDYYGLYFGAGEAYEFDRLHVNDIQPIFRNIGSARVGDLAISLRNLSTVFLFRPRTGKIIWLKTGSWIMQHDIDLLDDGTFSIFGNDMFYARSGFFNLQAYRLKGTSNVYVYDPETDTTATPYTKIIKEIGMYTETDGRSTILDNGDVFIEETGGRRLMRLSKDKVRWMFVNAQESSSYALHWCRYIAADQIKGAFN